MYDGNSCSIFKALALACAYRDRRTLRKTPKKKRAKAEN
jgi:hypothetical protein